MSWSEASTKIYDELFKSGIDPYACVPAGADEVLPCFDSIQHSRIMKVTKENQKTTIPVLSTCPFCGEDDAVASANPMMGQHYVICCCCEAQGPAAQTKRDAISLWNDLENAKADSSAVAD